MNKGKDSIYSFQQLVLLDRRDQCASVEPLVVYFGIGPPPAGQPGLSGLVVDGQKPTIPWSKIILEKYLPGPSLINDTNLSFLFGFSFHCVKSRAS